MSSLKFAIKNSWIALAQPQILIRLLIPLVVSVILALGFVVAGWIFITSDVVVSWFRNIDQISWFFAFLESNFGGFVLSFLLYIFLGILFFVISYLLIILVTSLLLVPLLSSVVLKIYFPNLSPNSEMSFWGGIWNTIKSVLAFLTLFLVCSPLLLLPGMQIILPLCLNTFLVRKLFLYDALQGIASKAEFAKLNAKHSDEIWKIALLNGIYLFIPGVNFIAPVLMTLGFLFFGFHKIQELRKTSN